MQGTIFYNSAGHWNNLLLTIGEIGRLTGDFGHFRMSIVLFQQPCRMGSRIVHLDQWRSRK